MNNEPLPVLEKIDTKELEKSKATLVRLIKEHTELFPDAEEKERRNFEERAEALKNRLNP